MRVGHRQAPNYKARLSCGLFYCLSFYFLFFFSVLLLSLLTFHNKLYLFSFDFFKCLEFYMSSINHKNYKQKRPYGGISQEERVAKRRKQLIDAAFYCIGSVGYQKTTVRMVCKEAGLTERYFYESFSNLEDLLCVCYDEGLNKLIEVLFIEINRAPNQVDEILKPAITAYFKFLNQERGIAKVLLTEMNGVSAKVDEFNQIVYGRFINLMTAYADSLLSDEQRKKYDMGLIMTGVIGSAIQLGLLWSLDNYEKPLEKLVNAYYEIFHSVTARIFSD